MDELYLGVEIGGSKLQICLGNGAGQIVERLRLAVDASQAAGGILRQLQETIPGLARAAKPSAVGVGFGGPVDWKTGRTSCSHQIEGWSQFALGSWLSALAGAPVLVDNDANVAALGEARRGAGRGFDPVFYVTLGSGVGGGLVANASIYHGAAPGEAEIGHIRLDRSGAIVESRCSGWAVDQKVRRAVSEHPESPLAKSVGDARSGEAKFLRAALAQHDPLAQKILDETAEDLAFGLSHVAHLFHPQVIVLGGGLSLLGDVLREAVEKSLRLWIMEAFAPGPKIALAQLGEDAVPVGAVELAAGALGRSK
jgi:glucokinase